MKNRLNFKASFWAVFFLITMAVFGYALFRRYFFGLGAISNLSDDMPWGLWIGFDLLCGVALAAGGFTITGVVVIFHLDRFKPIVRSTVLTAFIGYLMVIFALLIDVGKPWNLWRPLFFWNKHSVMWEVGLCVTLYTSVLFLEFLPLVWERFGFKKVLHFWHWLTPAFVIAGILLSTLHQSSLGTLYVIAPEKLHPLWYSPILPILFFTSAIPLGLAMVCCESFLSFRGLGKEIEHDILEKVGRATAVMLMLYLTIRLEDLIVRKSILYAFKLDLASLFFFIEVVLLGIVPMLLLFRSSVRKNPALLVLSQFLVVLGTIFNRMNVAITSFQLGTGAKYFPHPLEIVVSISVVAIGFLMFYLAVKFLPVFPDGPLAKAEPRNPFEDFSLGKD
jgi:Ni/Fe-hydrogenase subunit HybB-like protein